MRPYNLVIADDHVMFRQGLKKIINANPAFKIIGEASNGVELLYSLNRLPQI